MIYTSVLSLVHLRIKYLQAFLLILSLLSIPSCLPSQLMGEGPPPGSITGDIPANYVNAAPPFPLNSQQSILAGQGIYQRSGLNCVSCHGSNGRGNGPLSTSLDFQPADFSTQAMQLAFRDHQNYVFWWVSEGVPPTPMPAWKDILDDNARWQVIAYAYWLGQQPLVASTPTNGQNTGSQGADFISRMRSYTTRR